MAGGGQDKEGLGSKQMDTDQMDDDDVREFVALALNLEEGGVESAMALLSRITARRSAIRAAAGLGRRSMRASCSSLYPSSPRPTISRRSRAVRRPRQCRYRSHVSSSTSCRYCGAALSVYRTDASGAMLFRRRVARRNSSRIRFSSARRR